MLPFFANGARSAWVPDNGSTGLTKWMTRARISIAIRQLFLLSLVLCCIPHIGFTETFDTQKCREAVRQSICEWAEGGGRKCRVRNPEWHEMVLDVYDIYPASLQKIMCGLDAIIIDDNLSSTGAANHGSDRISIHSDIFRQNVTLSQWATWKIRLPFFQERVRYKIAADSLFVTAVHSSRVNGAVAYLLTHGLAHCLDKLNKITRQGDQRTGTVFF